MSIRDIIKEAIEKLGKETQLSDEKIDLLMEKAETVDKLAATIKGQAEDLVESASKPVKEPFESEMNFRGRIETYEGDPEALVGEGGTLRDTGTYWWRGLPIEVEVSWLDGLFTLNLFKSATGERCGHYSVKLTKLLAYIECQHDEGLKTALGSDYDRMFSDCVDRHDTLNPEGS